MGLREAYVGVHVLETNENYARADAPLLSPPETRQRQDYQYFESDQFVWERILSDPEEVWGLKFDIPRAALSEWVARVPGLYWKRGSEKMRQLSPAATESQSSHWLTYTPWGKSQKVSGGIGTLRLPPAADGTRLATLTDTLNASAGVPALLAPAVWDKIFSRTHRNVEGALLQGEARWQAMAEQWASRFPSTRDLPRGYLLLDNPDTVDVQDEHAPIQSHPFTVMEYYAGSKELFDFVYATADTEYPNYRQHVKSFFESYKDKNERYGRYLLSGDMVDPLWDAEFDSPADLRRADPSARPQLELLEARVRERMLGQDSTEAVLEVLGSVHHTPDEVRVLSEDIGIKAAVWYAGGSLAEVCDQFMAEVLRRGKLEELVQKLAARYPELITSRKE
jgi:hypothetical protein